MMMPSLSVSSTSVSATIRVDKATSELLAGPDWTMNIDICDICNSNHWLAKDVVKEVKRRLQHKNPKVQLLTLTLLETMVKNCGDYIHYHIAERKLLDEMIKIVKKKADLHVRDKILVLLDSWQEAFGGPGGKYSQYYWACDELRRFGVQFPQRPQRSAPIITPPVTQPPRAPQVGLGMPPNSSRRLEEAMTSEVEGLSFSTLESMRNVLELLDDMLRAVNPNDRMAVKDEVIVDLVERCRANQKKLMQMITTTTDENLLAQGLEMNDSLQGVLAKHDAIASGAPLPNQKSSLGVQQNGSKDSGLKTSDARDKDPAPPNGNSSSPAAHKAKDKVEEEEEEDEFAQLARRHSKAQSAPSQGSATGANGDAASSSSSGSNALVLIDAPAPAPAAPAASNTKEQDLIDLLSIVLTTSSTSSEVPQTPPNSAPVESTFEASLNSYVVPWAQPQAQQAFQPQPNQFQSQVQLQTQYQQPPMQPQLQPQSHQQAYSQYSSSTYPPPPWEAASGYSNNPYLYPTTMNTTTAASPMPMQGGGQFVNSFQNPQQYGSQQMYSSSSPSQMQGVRSLQHSNSFQNPASVNGVAMNGTPLVTNNLSPPIPSGGQKPFIPSYRLFEDLNVFGGSEGKIKSGPYPSASGNTTTQNMIAGRR